MFQRGYATEPILTYRRSDIKAPPCRIKEWDYSLGLIKIDGLTPSDEFLQLVDKEKRGEISTADMKKALDTKYKMKGETIANERSLFVSEPGNVD